MIWFFFGIYIDIEFIFKMVVKNKSVILNLDLKINMLSNNINNMLIVKKMLFKIYFFCIEIVVEGVFCLINLIKIGCSNVKIECFIGFFCRCIMINIVLVLYLINYNYFK